MWLLDQKARVIYGHEMVVFAWSVACATHDREGDPSQNNLNRYQIEASPARVMGTFARKVSHESCTHPSTLIADRRCPKNILY